MVRPLFQLQIVRAVAALIVVVFHVQGELRRRGFSDLLPDFTVGAFGVDLFFVVSGFIMVYASRRLFGRRGVALPFMARRIARVAPLYWVFTTVFAGIAVTLGRLPGHPQASASHIAASYLFLPALRPEDGAVLPVYSLGWTLNYEMFFYVCFAAAIGLRRGAAVAAVSTGLVGLVLVGRFVALPWPFFYWANPISLEFVFGMGIALGHLHGRRLPPRFGLPLSLAAMAVVAAYAPHIDELADWRGLAWGIPATVLVTTALGVETAGTSLPTWIATRLGDASYSLYLVHSALFIAAFALLSRVVDLQKVSPLAYASLLVLASIGAALVLFRAFETPVTRRLHAAIARRLDRDTGQADPAIAPGLIVRHTATKP